MSYLGETERFRATITDFDGTPQIPTSHVITLYDPSGSLETTDNAPTSEGGGVFYVDFRIPVDGEEGNWTVVWRTTYTVGLDSWYGVGVLVETFKTAP